MLGDVVFVVSPNNCEGLFPKVSSSLTTKRGKEGERVSNYLSKEGE
jgi:hypothetical protein